MLTESSVSGHLVMYGNTAIDKIERYKWTVQDKPGQFKMISKYDLIIDEAYQRDQSDKKVIGIAQKWSWIAFNSISVAKRGDKYYVIDGGHRVLAARRRSDVHDIPCLVFDVDDIKDEARGFLNINTARKSMSTADKFNALLMVQDPAAVLVKRVADEQMLDIGSDSVRGLRALATCMKWAKTDPKTFEYMFNVISGACLLHQVQITEIVIDGLMYIERCQEQAPTLGSHYWRERIWATGAKELINAAKSAAAYYKRGGAKIWADGMLKILNKGVRENRRLKIENELSSIE